MSIAAGIIIVMSIENLFERIVTAANHLVKKEKQDTFSAAIATHW